MAHKTLIEDFELVQGDNSPVWFIGHSDNILLNDGNWSGRYSISTKFGIPGILELPLYINSGVGSGDQYEVGYKFIFQILPAESMLLTGGKKYVGCVEIVNPKLELHLEIARFKLDVLIGG